MKIAFDVDGVLTDIEKFMYDYGSKYVYENNLEYIFKFDEYETQNMYSISGKENDKLWSKYIKEYCTKYPARKFASDVIDKIKNDGNEIYIITARGASLIEDYNIKLEDFRNILLNWLKENNIHYDKIIFSKEDKEEICLKEKIDIMVEDKPQNIMNISKHINVMCMNANYNTKCNNSNITRVYSFYDLYFKIKKLYNK